MLQTEAELHETHPKEQERQLLPLGYEPLIHKEHEEELEQIWQLGIKERQVRHCEELRGLTTKLGEQEVQTVLDEHNWQWGMAVEQKKHCKESR